MKFLTSRNSALLLAVGIFCAGCAGSVNSDNNQQQAKDSVVEAPQQLDPNRGALVKVNNRLFNVPSPLQLAGIFKKFNLPYRFELLNSVNKRSDYTTTFKQALNVGVYGADLGYINVYEQLPDAAAYFGAIRILTQDLGILNSFSESTMKRIENNNGNKDSLLYIASLIYRDSDSYLMGSDRSEVGALIIAGGWLEGLYLLTNITDVEQMKYKHLQIIGQQKYPLNNLIELLRPYYGKMGKEYDSFLDKLSDIASIYDGIEVKYNFMPSQTDEEAKTTTILCETRVMIDKAQVKLIADKVAKLREEIIN